MPFFCLQNPLFFSFPFFFVVHLVSPAWALAAAAAAAEGDDFTDEDSDLDSEEEEDAYDQVDPLSIPET